MRVAPGVLAVAALAGTASAQVYDDPETEAALEALERDRSRPPAPEEEGQPVPPEPETRPPPRPRRAPSLALRRGQIVVTLTAEASLNEGEAFKPASIAPDVSYGVTDRLTLAVVHSGFATTGFRGSAGGGICMTGDERACANVYDNAGVEALVDVLGGDVMIAAVAGVHALSFDKGFYAAKAGVQTSYRRGKLAATFSPGVLLGVTERDAMPVANKGFVLGPASIGAQLARPIFLALGGGVAAPLASTGDAWTARLGVIVRVRVARSTFVAASWFFPKLAGGSAVMDTGLGARTVNLWVTYSR